EPASQPEFLEALAAEFGRGAGRFLSAGPRARTPIALRVRASRIGTREVFVGNAAQALHPVAGQGLNLGLRDAWDLARVLRDAEDPGDERVLRRVSAPRRRGAGAPARLTELLARHLPGDGPPRG